MQASISLFVLVLSYIFQQRNRPFVTVKGLSDDLNLTAATLEAKLAERKQQAAAAIKGRSGFQSQRPDIPVLPLPPGVVPADAPGFIQ